MSLTGSVMLIQCDFDGAAAEHDDWHTHEHLHERLSIAGFRRGERASSTVVANASTFDPHRFTPSSSSRAGKPKWKLTTAGGTPRTNARA